MKNNTKFPVKKCVTATIVIFIVAFMLLGLLYTIVNNIGQNDYLWIGLLVWGILCGGLLVIYWGYQIHEYLRLKKKNEKPKERN